MRSVVFFCRFSIRLVKSAGRKLFQDRSSSSRVAEKSRKSLILEIFCVESYSWTSESELRFDEWSISRSISSLMKALAVLSLTSFSLRR